jgi:hypothetical protein
LFFGHQKRWWGWIVALGFLIMELGMSLVDECLVWLRALLLQILALGIDHELERFSCLIESIVCWTRWWSWRWRRRSSEELGAQGEMGEWVPGTLCLGVVWTNTQTHKHTDTQTHRQWVIWEGIGFWECDCDVVVKKKRRRRRRKTMV